MFPKYGALAVFLIACSHPALPPIAKQPMPQPDGKPPLLLQTPKTDRIASYQIRAKLDPKTHAITATETLRWKHNGSAPVSEVPLHLYMNAFKNETSVFMKESHGHHRSARKNDDSWGWIDVPSIRLAGAELRPNAKYGEDETTLTVPLGREVQPGEELALEIDFNVQLPEVFARTGYKGEFHLVGQWFPKIGVLLPDPAAGQKWHCDTFHLNSEFFADFGTYDVELTVPDTEVVVGTGVLAKAEDAEAGWRRLTYRAEDVHDFVFMADPYMQVARGTAKSSEGEVEVRVYHRPEQAPFAAAHLEAAKRTIETFGELFIPYPWAIMTVIDPPFDAEGSAGGMEYPTVVTTAADLDFARVWMAEGVTIHEVGHNWFQGMLASNEVDEAFLDEGFNEYADGIVADAWHGEDASMADNLVMRAGYYPEHRMMTDADTLVTPIATRSYDFASNNEYGAVTYGKTTLVLKTLENMVGRERFLAAMAIYTHRWAFKHPTRADFFAAMKEGLGEEFSGYLSSAFLAAGGVDFSMGPISTLEVKPPRGVFGDGATRTTVKEDDDKKKDDDKAKKTWDSQVNIFRLGVLEVPVVVRFQFADGTVANETWDGHGGWKKFTFQRPAELSSVWIDPEGKVTVEHQILDDSWREEENSGPSWRAGVRAGFWEQTLESLVGL